MVPETSWLFFGACTGNQGATYALEARYGDDHWSDGD
jgi:hypothetical protein